MHDRPGYDGSSGAGSRPAGVELPLAVVGGLPVGGVGGRTHVHGDGVVQREVQLTYGHKSMP